MNVSIRKATVGDLEEILRLNKALFDYETKFSDEYDLGWPYSDAGRSYFTKKIVTDLSVALVAEVGKRIIGYIVVSIYSHPFRKTNPIAELDNMFLEEEYRGQGIGKRLIEKAKEIAKQKGAKRFKVEAATQNKRVIEFYRRCGFNDFDVILEMKLS